MKDFSTARGTGCPLATVVSRDEQRSFTEGLVDPHRAARSKSDLCSMILRLAHGLGNKAVAAEIGVPELEHFSSL